MARPLSCSTSCEHGLLLASTVTLPPPSSPQLRPQPPASFAPSRLPLQGRAAELRPGEVRACQVVAGGQPTQTLAQARGAGLAPDAHTIRRIPRLLRTQQHTATSGPPPGRHFRRTQRACPAAKLQHHCRHACIRFVDMARTAVVLAGRAQLQPTGAR